MVIRNIFALLIGSAVYVASSLLLSFIFGLLYKIPILLAVLSWPVGPELYASVIINTTSFFMAYWACDSISGQRKSARKTANIIFCGCSAFFGVIALGYNIWAGKIGIFLVGWIVFIIMAADFLWREIKKSDQEISMP